jgi:hypothetical protein
MSRLFKLDRFVRVTELSGKRLSAPAWGVIVWADDRSVDCDVEWFLFDPADVRALEMDVVDKDDECRQYSIDTLPSKVMAAYAAWRMTNAS